MRRFILALIITSIGFSDAFASASAAAAQRGWIFWFKRTITTTITSPTSNASYDAAQSSTVTLSGTARGADFTNCTWTNSLGGSGTATGTTSWSISNIALSVGSNVITVTCNGDEGDSGSDTITVTRSASGGGPTISNLSDNTPAVGQDLNFTGANFINQDTTGWALFWTQDPDRHTFNGPVGSVDNTPPSISLGFDSWSGPVVFDDGSAFGAYSSPRLFPTSNSVRFHSVELDQPIDCGHGFPEAPSTAQSYGVWNNEDSGGNSVALAEGHWGFFVKFHRDAGQNWPNNFQKWSEHMFAQFYVTVKVSGLAANTDPTTWVMANTACGSCEEKTWSLEGGVMAMDVWHWLDFDFKVTNPTNFNVRVNGTQRGNPVTPTENTPLVSNVPLGFINACSSGEQTWDVYGWMGYYVFSSQRVRPPTAMYACNDATDNPDTDDLPGVGCVWQRPKSLAEDATTYTYKKTGPGVTLNTGTTAYFIALDNRGQKSNVIAHTVP